MGLNPIRLRLKPTKGDYVMSKTIRNIKGKKKEGAKHMFKKKDRIATRNELSQIVIKQK